MQDDLTSMFNKSMNFSASRAQNQATHDARPPPTPTANFSISQHYHHSAHQVPLAENIEEASSEEKIIGSYTVALLSDHNIDPYKLSPSQVKLFESASPEQRERLIQLWQISGPQSEQLHGETSIEKEEERARYRYEQMTAAAASSQDMEMLEEKPGELRSAEPYVKSGYEILAERDYNLQAQTQQPRKVSYSPLGTAVGLPHALDPAFSSREWWRDFVGDQPMEFQYGMFEHMSHYQHQAGEGKEDSEML